MARYDRSDVGQPRERQPKRPPSACRHHRRHAAARCGSDLRAYHEFASMGASQRPNGSATRSPFRPPQIGLRTQYTAAVRNSYATVAFRPLRARGTPQIRSLRPPMMLQACFGALLLGVSSSSSALPKDYRRVAPVETAPLLIVQTNCEAMVPAYCRGRYGFFVARSGKWFAGPDPTGFSVPGRVSKADSRRLRRAADQFFDRASRPLPDCERRQAIPGVGETVTVQGPEWAMKLEGAGGQLDPSCAEGHPSAPELFALADALMRRYYPHPFRRH